ncbi:MAG: hypothetical protein HWN67_10380 [Candidatus Helarchaeota archaeon]|nr:hypothetical protein [Candidatus Helarchaeota archaeon]
MEEALKNLKDISKSFQQFMGSLEKVGKQINKIHNLVEEKIGMLSKDTHNMVEFIKKEDEKSNKLISDLAEKTTSEIKRFYDYFELEKINKMIKDLKTEIKVPELKGATTPEDLKSVLSEIKKIVKRI